MYEINRNHLLCKHISFILATWLPSHCHIDRLILSSHCHHRFPCTLFDNMTININTHRHIYFSMSKYIFYHALFPISSYNKILSLPIYFFIRKIFVLTVSSFLLNCPLYFFSMSLPLKIHPFSHINTTLFPITLGSVLAKISYPKMTIKKHTTNCMLT